MDENEHGKKLMWLFVVRLTELKSAVGPDGKAVCSRRVDFQIQDLLDLRQGRWQKKMLKEAAKSIAGIRRDAEVEAKTKAKTGKDMFTTEIAGQRPACIVEASKKETAKQAAGAKEVPSTPDWDAAYVKKLFGYFCEDRDGDDLAIQWKKGAPGAAEARMATDTLLDIGFSDRSKGDAAADAIATLVSRGALGWSILGEALARPLETLDDLKMDIPFCDVFVQGLVAKLLHATGRNFDTRILTHLPPASESTWNVLCGALRTLKEFTLMDPIETALRATPQLADILCKARGLRPAHLRKQLRAEGLLP